MRVRIYCIMKFRNLNILSMNILKDSTFKSHFLVNTSKKINDIQELRDIEELKDIEEFEDTEILKDIRILFH